MKLLSQNKNIFELKITSLNDLLILSEILNKNDIIYSITTRKIKLNERKQITKTLFLEIKINNIQFDGSNLKINGFIQNETDFTSKGQSHSLIYKEGDIIKFEKISNWLKFEKNLFEKALNNISSNKNLLIILENNLLRLYEFDENNFELILENQFENGKFYINEIDIIEESKKIIYNLLNQKKYNQIILTGNIFYYEKLYNILKQNYKNILSFKTNNLNNIQKLILEIYKNKNFKNSNLANEQFFVDKFLKELSKNLNKISYSEENIKNNINKIEYLLITTKKLLKLKENNNLNEFYKLFYKIEKVKGEIIIINSKNEPGKILDSFGGLIALFRY